MLTQKQESFALNLFSGMKQREAYLKAGYSTKQQSTTLDENASRMAADSKVLARIEELRAPAANSTKMLVAEREERLSEIARGRLVDFIDKNGNITLDAPHNGALQEVTVQELRSDSGTSLTESKKVKLYNPIAAIQELNKMDGAYPAEKHALALLGGIDLVVRYVEKGEQ